MPKKKNIDIQYPKHSLVASLSAFHQRGSATLERGYVSEVLASPFPVLQVNTLMMTMMYNAYSKPVYFRSSDSAIAPLAAA